MKVTTPKARKKKARKKMEKNRRDRHHIVHNRAEWNLRPAGAMIRREGTLIPEMPRTLHNLIHSECPSVPLLAVHSLERTAQMFRPGRDTLESMDNLMSAIEKSVDHPRAHELERNLAMLAIEAIDLQRPYIQELYSRRNAVVIPFPKTVAR